MESFYGQLDEGRFDSLPATAGPWTPHAQHAGPPAALLARAIETHQPRADMRLADLRLDILGPIPVVPLTLEVEVLRGGRSMELLQATAAAGGRAVAVARGWRIVRAPEDFPRLVGHRTDDVGGIPQPSGAGRLRMPGAHVDGYVRAVEWRFVEGGIGTGGTAVAWGRQLVPLVAGEEPSPWQRTLVLADSGSGITLTVDPRRHTYINCDLHVVLDRDPEGEWIRLSSQALATPGHGGTVHTSLGDVRGDLGTGLQTMWRRTHAPDAGPFWSPVTAAIYSGPAMSQSAASHLSPAFPRRAAWGTAGALRAWQADALQRYLSSGQTDFLAVATPGAGKTTFALRVATELLTAGEISAVTVVAPTEHLKTQWADAAARVGIHLDPKFSNTTAVTSSDYDGVAVTYAQVASRPSVHEDRTRSERTLVILDEIHHGGDSKSWGDGIRQAFEHATRRLSLTGTPFRSDTNPIPFVGYEYGDDGILRSSSDYTYGYAEALRDGVVRPVLFMAYGGAMRWRTRAGDEVAARLGEPMTKDLVAQAWRTALDPKGEWIPSVLAAADKRLTEVRRGVPDAGAMVIASNQTQARAYARILTGITGEKPTIVLSDDAGASSRIEEFSASTSRWLVAVRMVSEGVDVPRLCVGVYATSTSTPLFFAQAVGRFVRARARGETACVFLPSVPVVLAHAGALEQQRDHALDRPEAAQDEAPLWSEEEGMLAAANRSDSASDDLLGSFEALESDAHFDHVLYDAQQFGLHAEVGSEDEQDYLGLPGLLEPDQVHALLNERQTKQSKRTAAKPARDDAPVAAHRALAAQRKELNGLVAAYATKTGSPHANIHMDLRRACGGPELAQATSEQVTERIERIRRWFVGRR